MGNFSTDTKSSPSAEFRSEARGQSPASSTDGTFIRSPTTSRKGGDFVSPTRSCQDYSRSSSDNTSNQGNSVGKQENIAVHASSSTDIRRRILEVVNQAQSPKLQHRRETNLSEYGYYRSSNLRFRTNKTHECV